MEELKNSRGQAGMKRIHRKSILFNQKELAAINQYCDKYKIKSKSSFFRSIIINHIMNQADIDYPKLF